MKKFRVGLLTMSDGRPYLHQTQFEMNMRYQNDIKEALEATGLVEVVAGTAPVNSNAAAKEEALRLKEAGVEMTIFNY
ncbi:MAG: fucose isomerase, partial [Clostridia bacterium]|nr:fucose isomerase [Clostridia bacterium]